MTSWISSIGPAAPLWPGDPAGAALCLWALALLCCCAAAGGAEGSSGSPGRVRPAVLAGQWYEADPAALARSVEEHLSGAGRPEVPIPEGAEEARRWAEGGRHPRALIVPHAGHVYSGPCAGAGFRLLAGSRASRVVLLGPSHRVGFRGAALPDAASFATPLGEIPLDLETIAKLRTMPGFQGRTEAHATEHSLEIELPFLQRVLPAGFRLIPILVGRLERADLDALGAALHPLLDESTLLVVSSDFTHYGPNYDYLPFRADIPDHLRKLDLGAADRILERDLPAFEAYLAATDVTICGAEPIRLLLRALEGIPLEARLMEYYRSGDMLDDFRNSVSYATLAFFPMPAEEAATPPRDQEEAEPDEAARPLDRDEQAFLLDLARRTVRAVVHGQNLPDPETPARFAADSPLREERGVFVTLTTRRDGQLRGCIGSILGDRPLCAGVVHNAVAAAISDPRFPPVEPAEEPGLHVEISVLTPLQRVAGPDEIRIGRHGVLLEKGGRRAVFLPQVAVEQGWDRDVMLRHLAMKAGLAPNEWRSGCAFHVFEAQVFEESDLPGGR